MVTVLRTPETRIAPNDLLAAVCVRKPPPSEFLPRELLVEFPLPALLHQHPLEEEAGILAFFLESYIYSSGSFVFRDSLYIHGVDSTVRYLLALLVVDPDLFVVINHLPVSGA